MENFPPFDQFLFAPDQVFLSDTTFDNTLGFLKFIAADPDENLSLDNEILVFELKEGVFIRTHNREWSQRLTALSENPVQNYPRLKLFPAKKLDDLARAYRQPLSSFGDYRLVRWKVGF
ncbi:MAG TPA: hypothetical protein VGN63_03290 [Flavisolibacter sp.]|jgi:hypothetical protein|nr:hypothetical protein [Flavisolibacter sp.]